MALTNIGDSILGEDEFTTDTQVRNGIMIKTLIPTNTRPVGVLIVTHGYSEHSGRYEDLAKTVVRQSNWACVLHDVRGHGDSQGDRGYIGSFKEYMKDMENVQNVAENISTTSGSIVFFGHSNGGLITLLYLSHPIRGKNSRIKACILSAPFVDLATPLTSIQRVLIRLLAGMMPKMKNTFDSGFEVNLSHDPEMHKSRRLDTKCFTHSTVGWLNQAFRAQALIKKNIRHLKVPTFWFIPGQDLVCSSKASLTFIQKLQGLEGEGSRMVRVYEYPDCFHEIFFETIREKPTRELLDILSKL